MTPRPRPRSPGMDTEPCPACDGRRTVEAPAHPTHVAHWDADGHAGECPAQARWASDNPAHWHHPRA